MTTKTRSSTGSQKAGEPVFLVIGHLQRPHGVAGEIAMKVLTDFPERICKGRVVLVGAARTPVKITQVRWKQGLMLIKFEGFAVREKVAELTNMDVFVSGEGLPDLPDGEYYHHQLIGLDVYEGEEFLGVINDILVTGANDVYVVQKAEGKELLLPAIQSVILEIDLERHRMDVSIPDGLIDWKTKA
jgi:16S rRNA processing protein RimM